MNIGNVAAIADAVLYEGYILWPYRPSALKNRRRLSFGALEPGARLSCEVLIEAREPPDVELLVRFLHPITRRIRHEDRFVDSLDVDGVTHWAWEEALEREVQAAEFCVDGGESSEPLSVSAAWVRNWLPARGACRQKSTELSPGTYRLRVEVDNLSDAAIMHACHVVCRARNGRFVSLNDSGEACQNAGTWPILVGDPARRDLLLCSPIILEDFPRIAPESDGDCFDATENDELLLLNIASLSDAERAEMAKADPRAAALLDRVVDGKLHGTFRSRLRPGDHVRLAPKRRADAFDIALAGRRATVLEVLRDQDNRCFVAVSVDDDPGRDFDMGHRFFFHLDEVEAMP